MDPTRCLRDEHQVILKVLDCFDVALRRASLEQRLEPGTIGRFVEFFRGFADRCHHCKEEDRLFPCLEACGMPREQGPIAVMLHEHQLGRDHVRAIAESCPAAEAGNPSAFLAVLEHGRAFLELLRHHIMKEDHVLFEMADQMITGPRIVELTNSYSQAESQTAAVGGGYRDTFTRCRALADELCAQYEVDPPPQGLAT